MSERERRGIKTKATAAILLVVTALSMPAQAQQDDVLTLACKGTSTTKRYAEDERASRQLVVVLSFFVNFHVLAHWSPRSCGTQSSAITLSAMMMLRALDADERRRVRRWLRPCGGAAAAGRASWQRWPCVASPIGTCSSFSSLMMIGECGGGTQQATPLHKASLGGRPAH